MLAEFHDRLVRSLSVLFLPFHAVPFALGARRARQSLGIAVGLFVLVAYNQVLTIGKSLASISSEERGVGKECVGTCRSQWSRTHSQKKQIVKQLKYATS